MTGLFGTLACAAMVQLTATEESAICVAVSDDRADTLGATEAALSALANGVRVDTRSLGSSARPGTRCTGFLAIGQAALNAVAAGGTAVPVVAALVPNVGPIVPDRAPVAAVAFEPEPDAVLAVLAQLAPRVRRVAVVYDPAVTGDLVALAEKAAPRRGLQLVAITAVDQAAAIRAFHRLEREVQIDALWILPDRTTTTFETAHQALKLAHWKRIPVIGPSRWYLANGALFALEPVVEEHGRLAAQMLQKIVSTGARGKVISAPGASLLVNQRAMDRLGLRIPPGLNPRVTEVIQ